MKIGGGNVDVTPPPLISDLSINNSFVSMMKRE
jgi:hypothetical protein